MGQTVNKLTKWSRWYLIKSKDGSSHIRRYRKSDGRFIWQRMPFKKYRHVTTIEEMELFVKRANASREIEERLAKQRHAFDSAFISTRTIDDFETSLYTKADNRQHVSNARNALVTHVLPFFINQMKVPDPNFWQRFEDKFGSYLISKKLSVGYLKRIVQVTNRFLNFLHRRNPEEIKLVRLQPFSQIKLRSIDADNQVLREKYIPETDYKTMLSKVDPALVPAIKIGYTFGLRRSEVLGLNHGDVFEDALEVKRQLLKTTPIRSFGPLKSKASRSIPFWFSSPQDVYDLISQLPDWHPDTLIDKFAKAMSDLKMPYQFHDFRRTFITNALRLYNARDVQLAAGHSDLRTTMRYAQDDRQLQRKQFKPKFTVLKNEG